MKSEKGWLYVNSQSATFVTNDPFAGFEKYTWSVLADKKLLDSFLAFFEPLKIQRNRNYDSYYIEIDEIVLLAWFECFVLPYQ